jgi:hypothetical protein
VRGRFSPRQKATQMSDEKDQKDLKDEELDQVSGGFRGDPMAHRPGEGLPLGERGEEDLKQGGPIHPGL